jgi:hypothetical protein
MLWDELKAANAKFLLTKKLNQDCLENFFGAVRENVAIIITQQLFILYARSKICFFGFRLETLIFHSSKSSGN